MRRVVLANLAAGAQCVVGVGPVSAQPPVSPIEPDQAFNGVVNDSIANAVIRMVCPGPEGRIGHPLHGQVVEVVPAASTTAGFTGHADRIAADIFFATPRSVVPPRLAVFRYYEDPAAISTSLLFPFSGVVARP